MIKSLEKLARKKSLRVVGLMSGTSADGVDAAIVEIGLPGRRRTGGGAKKDNELMLGGGGRINLLAFKTFPFPPALRHKIFQLARRDTSHVDDICHFNFVLGEVFADAVVRLARESRIGLKSIDLIGSHGQTIYHLPDGKRFGNRRIRSTLQIGEPSVIAQRTGITTVADFRVRDVAAGGQGAPLVPYADYFLFAGRSKTRAVQNIGGIANVTYLPAGGSISDVIALDTGPGNMMIDHICFLVTGGRNRYDAGGKLAARGNVNQTLLKDWLKHPFFRRRPPRTTGRETFGVVLSDKYYQRARRRGIDPVDILSTATAFTARTISESYRRFFPKPVREVILCGGGAHNRTLCEMIRREVHPAVLTTTDEFGIGVDAKEAVSFAILACQSIRGRADNVPSATGASKAVVLGKIIPCGD